MFQGQQVRCSDGASAHAGAAVPQGGLSEGGAGAGQHSQAAELPARLQRGHPLADAAHCRHQ